MTESPLVRAAISKYYLTLANAYGNVKSGDRESVRHGAVRYDAVVLHVLLSAGLQVGRRV
jgi:hypothetical protein